jgi:hypothetical protein
MRRIRICILSLCLLTAIAVASYAFVQGADTSVDRFVADFDNNIAHDKVAAEMVARDPAFRARVLRATADAYASGGWPAAEDKLNSLMSEKAVDVWSAEIDADDAVLVAYSRAYLQVLRRAEDQPATCRLYASGTRFSAQQFPTAKSQLVAESQAMLAAFESGQRNLDAAVAPQMPSAAAAQALLEKSTAVGVPFTAVEWAALKGASGGPGTPETDAVFCSAMIKKYANITALPESEAAQLIRYEWTRSLVQRGNWASR